MLDIISAVVGQPWAIRGDIAAHVQSIVMKDGIAALRELAEIRSVIGRSDRTDALQARRAGGSFKAAANVAVIQVFGAMTQRGGFDGATCEEFMSTVGIGESVKAAVADKSIDSVLLEIDSPGGSVFGVQETWDVIHSASKQKPIVAFVNAQCGSAAFWLASACSEIWITPSGMIGSVGVFGIHLDESKALEMQGRKITFISAGKYKVEGNPTEPASEEFVAATRERIGTYYSAFTAGLSKGLGVPVAEVRDGFGEGRMVTAKAALSMKMVTGICTYDQAVRHTAQLASGEAEKMKAEVIEIAPVAETLPVPTPIAVLPPRRIL